MLRTHIFIVTTDFFNSLGERYIHRNISVRAMNKTSARNKVKKEWGNKKRFGKMKIIKVVRVD